MSYQSLFERLFTFLGKQYSFLIFTADPELTGANPYSRQLLLAARTAATEGKYIKGTVVRFDISPPVSPKKTKRSAAKVPEIDLSKPTILAALEGRDIPANVPLVLAFVGVDEESLKTLALCTEKSELTNLIKGGYMVLNFPGAKTIHLNLCDKKGKDAQKFFIRNETFSPDLNVTFAIRVGKAETQAEAKVEPARIKHAPVRSTRWLPVKPVQDEQKQKPMIITDSTEWENLVQKSVEQVLSKIVSDKEKTQTDLGDGLVLRIWPDMLDRISRSSEWRSVFTHQSVDPLPHRNYEANETLGDEIMSLSLVHYIYTMRHERSSAVDSDTLTDIKKELLSDNKQADMAITMGLDKPGLIRSSVLVDRKILEDVTEAFFGCLFTVTNDLTQGSNQGLPICEALLRQVIADTFPSLDILSIGKDAPTTLTQLFQRLGWGEAKFLYNEETRVTTIRLNSKAQDFLDGIGPPVNRNLPLAVGPPSYDKKSSKKAASVLALETLLLSWGIDTNYASVNTRDKLLKDPRYAKIHNEALGIAKTLGYADIYVYRRPKHKCQFYSVMGIRPDGKEEQLHVYKYTSPEGEIDPEAGLSSKVAAFISALKGFIAKH